MSNLSLVQDICDGHLCGQIISKALCTFSLSRKDGVWCVLRFGSKNGHQKDTMSRKDGCHDYHLSTILSSLVNIIRGAFVII